MLPCAGFSGAWYSSLAYWLPLSGTEWQSFSALRHDQRLADQLCLACVGLHLGQSRREKRSITTAG